MQIHVTEHIVRTTILATNERIDAFSAPVLRNQIHETLANQCYRVVIDLSDVPFLDSAGMAALVSGLKIARQHGGDIKLVWPRSEAARRILRLTRFDKVFEMVERAEDAIPRFA
jgi:anti-sigma B factor antagonist